MVGSCPPPLRGHQLCVGVECVDELAAGHLGFAARRAVHASFGGEQADHALLLAGVPLGEVLPEVDLGSGVQTDIGALGIGTDEDGFIIDSSGIGYLLQSDIGGSIYTVDLTTGAATLSVAYSNANAKFESAALQTQTTVGVVPEPITATLGLMGLATLGIATRRRVA